GYTLHPALLDAALHPIALAADGPGDQAQLPFAWEGVTLHAVQATALRVTITPTGTGVAITATDPAGQPVATIDTLTLRPFSGLPSAPARDGHLYALSWPSISPTEESALDGPCAILGTHDPDSADALRAALTVAAPLCGDLNEVSELSGPPPVILVPCPPAGTGGEPGVVDGAHALTRQVLRLLQEFLTDDRLGGSRLVLLTTDAVAVGADDVDLAQSPLWGLVRSVQAEHPGRITLIDLDDPPAAYRMLLPAIGAALDRGEPHLAIRGSDVHVPRLARLPDSGDDGGAPDAFVPGGTVLVTGGTGTLGRLVAEHLVTVHGVTHLILASRSGPNAPEAQGLHRHLEELGAQVTIAACDAADGEQLTRLLANIPEDHPLTAVIHAAGVIDDAIATSLT
ncbi:SDR family oxidoreductase, partial [Actinomadura sp. 7K534]|uniref:SDR family oxidoreductase n=1 Tax=Actinomadura sp. 7K534 TaxID=2530366 RepID=UPI001053BE7F